MAGLRKVATDVTISVGACEGKGEGLEVGAGVVMLFIGLGVGAGGVGRMMIEGTVYTYFITNHVIEDEQVDQTA